MESIITSKYDSQVEVVVGVMIVRENKVLLIQSPKWGDNWLFPGGHVEYGESLF
jgi:8-oxo-dGTP pyrophosphatase MutT (NUDIX family)